MSNLNKEKASAILQRLNRESFVSSVETYITVPMTLSSQRTDPQCVICQDELESVYIQRIVTFVAGKYNYQNKSMSVILGQLL